MQGPLDRMCPGVATDGDAPAIIIESNDRRKDDVIFAGRAADQMGARLVGEADQ